MYDLTLDRLIRERIPGRRYGLFFGSGEGTIFPNGVEDYAGHIVDEDGVHYLFWTDWDAERGEEYLSTWEVIVPCPDDGWDQDSEYLAARTHAGLSD